MRITLTTTRLMAELRKPRTKTKDFADDKTPGLTLRITLGGGASWSTRRMLADGRYARVSLGSYPAVGIGEARKRALNAQSALSAGRDLVGEKRAIRAKAQADKNRLTVADAWRSYAHAKTTGGAWGDAHATNAELFFGRVLDPAFGPRALMDVTRADWTRLIAAAGKGGQGAKANALRFIRGFDSYAEVAGWIPHAVLPRKSALLAPPCPPRQNTPTDDDIVRIWNAADTLRPKARVYTRLLILTAARRGEVADIRAGEIDLDAGLWRLPGARSKNKTAHTMPLNALALAELTSIWPTEPVPERHCLLGESGYSGLQNYSRVKDALDAAIGNDAWVVHDLRRAARTGMARLGVPSDHAEAALNHVSHRSALERTYNTHGYADEAVAALRVWQNHVERLLHPDTAEIVPMPIRRAG
jgi:integrase